MEKTFQYQQQIFASLELEIYNDLLKKVRFFYSEDRYGEVGRLTADGADAIVWADRR